MIKEDIPCKDCITLSICRARMQTKYYPECLEESLKNLRADYNARITKEDLEGNDMYMIRHYSIILLSHICTVLNNNLKGKKLFFDADSHYLNDLFDYLMEK